jgi:hypothetical protein
MLSVTSASRLLLKRSAFRVWRSPFSTAVTFEGSNAVAASSFHPLSLSLQTPLQWNQMTVSLDRIITSPLQSLAESIWNMSSTLKKRRHKMNKHKLRKRRKKLRLKSKK